MGLYLHRGRLAFFRQCERVFGDDDPENIASGELLAEGSATRSRAGESEIAPWESTGFISDLGWAEGRRLTPCLAFRDEGAYRVRVVRIGTLPPVPTERWNAENYSDAG